MTKEEFIEKWLQFRPGGELYLDVMKDLNDLIDQEIYNDNHDACEDDHP